MSHLLVVGVVAAIARFPVKSMAAEPVEALDLRWPGIHGDRQYAFTHLGNQGRFPWLTGRDLPALVLHRAAYRDPEDPRASPLEITTPEGERLALNDEALAERLSAAGGKPVTLMQSGRGIFDTMPVSLASTTGLAAVDAAHGTPLDPRRFRLNILIESDQPDSAWAGQQLQFGEGDAAARLLVNDGIPRCAMITLDPDTATRDATVMRTVAQRFDNKVGMYGVTARQGMIRVGDVVRLVI